MREIKFRGKRVDNGGWVYGDLISNLFLKTKTRERIPYIIDPYKLDYECFEDVAEQLDEFEVDPATVGQYIERQDDHGEDLWEGDILNIQIHDHAWKKVIVEQNVAIEYENGKFGVRWGFEKELSSFDGFCRSATTFKKVGNIHDNPELLEVKS